MNLFIEQPQRQADHAAWIPHEATPRQRDAVEARADAVTDCGDDSPAGRTGRIPYSQAQQSYREELAYNKKRVRRRRWNAVVRVLAFLVLLPLFLVGVFVGVYVLTCILNGASPDELVELLGELVAYARALVEQVLQMLKN